MSMSRPTKQEKAEREEAVAHLKSRLHPGDTVYTVLRHVSKSGMQREISLHFIDEGDLCWITGYAARAMGDRVGKRDGIVVGGCGMDMGFHLVYNLGRTLWPEGVQCAGEGKCRSNDHYNEGRKAEGYSISRIHRDGGYTLRHCWI